MNFENPLLIALVVVSVVTVGLWIAGHYFSKEAKQDRRRRRNNARISSTAKRPTIKFSVRTDKSKKP